MREYKLINGKFLEDGHTMFEEDVLKKLQRLARIESELFKTNGGTSK